MEGFLPSQPLPEHLYQYHKRTTTTTIFHLFLVVEMVKSRCVRSLSSSERCIVLWPGYQFLSRSLVYTSADSPSICLSFHQSILEKKRNNKYDGKMHITFVAIILGMALMARW